MTDERIKESFVKAKIVLPRGVEASNLMLDAIFENYKEEFKTAERLAKIEVLEELLKGCPEGCGSVRTLFINEVIDKLKDGK